MVDLRIISIDISVASSLYSFNLYSLKDLSKWRLPIKYFYNIIKLYLAFFITKINTFKINISEDSPEFEKEIYVCISRRLNHRNYGNIVLNDVVKINTCFC